MLICTAEVSFNGRASVVKKFFVSIVDDLFGKG